MIPQCPPLMAAVFDLDGTLVDAFEDIRRALNAALAPRGLPLIAPEEIKPLVGNGLRRLIEDAVGGRLAAEEKQTLARDYARQYEEHLTDTTRVYEGMEDVLRQARARGLRLAVLSNKPHDLTAGIIERTGLAPYFDLVWGQRPGSPRKPDPACLRLILERLRAPCAATVVVGDGETDMAMGRAAGTRLAACLYGARSREQLSPFNPDVWIAQPADLAKWIDEMAGERKAE